MHSLMIALAFLTGCERDSLSTYPVQGKVQFDDGTPVRSGFVETYSPKHQVNARGKITKDGSFQLTTFREADGAVAGTHDVIVVQFLGHEMASNVAHDHGEAVATRFADYATSGLSLEVSEQEENECVITVSRYRY